MVTVRSLKQADVLNFHTEVTNKSMRTIKIYIKEVYYRREIYLKQEHENMRF